MSAWICLPFPVIDPVITEACSLTQCDSFTSLFPGWGNKLLQCRKLKTCTRKLIWCANIAVKTLLVALFSYFPSVGAVIFVVLQLIFVLMLAKVSFCELWLNIFFYLQMTMPVKFSCWNACSKLVLKFRKLSWCKLCKWNLAMSSQKVKLTAT